MSSSSRLPRRQEDHLPGGSSRVELQSLELGDGRSGSDLHLKNRLKVNSILKFLLINLILIRLQYISLDLVLLLSLLWVIAWCHS